MPFIRPWRVIDLFCGCGGFSEGFRQAGFEVVLAVDNWEVALKSHEANHPGCEHWNRDILTITPDEFMRFKADVLIGSPPCPDFSVINIKKQLKTLTPDISLLNHFQKIGKSYKYYIGENVEGVRPYLNGTKYQILSANLFYLWHLRKRCFFGLFPTVRPSTRNPTPFPTPTCGHGVKQRRIDLPLYRRYEMDASIQYPPHVGLWIMGFPETYKLIGSKTDQVKQVGNAVCPPVARAIAEAIKKQADGGL